MEHIMNERKTVKATVTEYGSKQKLTISLLPTLCVELPQPGRLLLIGDKTYVVNAVYSAMERYWVKPVNQDQDLTESIDVILFTLDEIENTEDNAFARMVLAHAAWHLRNQLQG